MLGNPSAIPTVVNGPESVCKLLARTIAPSANTTDIIFPAINTHSALANISFDSILPNNILINKNTILIIKKGHMILNFPWVVKNCNTDAAKPTNQLSIKL